jgi:uncharacterized protein
MPYGLSDSTIDLLKKVFDRYEQVSEVILYGSRAKGNYAEGSDIDLTIKGQELEFADLQNISKDIDDLLLPWMVDISIFATIKNNDLIEHIQRVGKTIYKRTRP